MAKAYNKKVILRVLKKRPYIEKTLANIRRRLEQMSVEL
jgi:hypothetical protein